MKKWSMKVFGIAAVGVLVCLLGMDQAGAWNQADLDKLLETGFCRECNLARADLSRAKLLSVDVQGSNLGMANLSGADLREAKLGGVDLSGADLSGAYLSGADLYMANLSGADLTGARLNTAILSEADLSGADLSGADLSWVDLTGATWTDGRKCAEGSYGSIGECK